MIKIVTISTGLAVVLASFAFALVVPVLATHATTTPWETTGDYIVNMEHQSVDDSHDMTLIQDGDGNLTGNGGSPAGNNTYLWTITDGLVTDDSIVFTADYTATADAVTPQTTLLVEGEIAADGTMSGSWSDNYQGGERSGNWSTVLGTAARSEESADQNHDGFIDTLEGQPFYGVIAVSLTETGDTSPDSGLALDRFPVANSDGSYTYARTITVSDEVRDSLTNGAIVVHGFDIDNSGAYDGSKESSIAAGVPFEATVPVACGAITGTAGSFTADLSQMNSSGVNGNATLTVSGNEVTLLMEVSSTSPDLAHAQHIHIGGTNTCPPNTAGAPVNESTTVTVTITKFIQGEMANATTAQSADFPMTSTFEAENTGAGGGTYILGASNPVPYQAITSDLTRGADYATNEILTGDTVSAECTTETPFALVGYTTGDSQAAAMTATLSTTSPSFTNMQDDMFVIVWNRDCSQSDGEINGEVGGGAVLEVTAIEMIDTTATANGSFADGWKYVFHVTAPMDEDQMAMKFSDWLQTDGSGTIPVTNNIRISSLQADNDGATILLTAADVYSTPALRMTADLDSEMPGRQVEITVEVAVPNGTPNGTYTTNYGVQSTI